MQERSGNRGPTGAERELERVKKSLGDFSHDCCAFQFGRASVPIVPQTIQVPNQGVSVPKEKELLSVVGPSDSFDVVADFDDRDTLAAVAAIAANFWQSHSCGFGRDELHRKAAAIASRPVVVHRANALAEDLTIGALWPPPATSRPFSLTDCSRTFAARSSQDFANSSQLSLSCSFGVDSARRKHSAA
jgi:hypothetical protein